METCHFLFQAPARMCRLPLPLPWGASVIAIISAHLAMAACLAPSEAQCLCSCFDASLNSVVALGFACRLGDPSHGVRCSAGAFLS